MTALKTIALMLLLMPALKAQSGPFLFVFLNTNPNKPELSRGRVDSLMAGHLENIERLSREGKILAAGPFYGGGGIFIMSTASRDTAWEWLKTDPGVRANRWIIELLPYIPRIGSVCPVGEDYEMVGYGFVRYSAAKITKEDRVALMGEHLTYLKSVVPADSIVAEGVFGEGEGSILVMRGKPDANLLGREPAVLAGKLQIDVKKLWIARGSFCKD